MIYRLGRFLQLLGLFIAPAGIVGNVVEKDRVGEGVMLTILCVGAAVFFAGWLLQQMSRPK